MQHEIIQQRNSGSDEYIQPNQIKIIDINNTIVNIQKVAVPISQDKAKTQLPSSDVKPTTSQHCNLKKRSNSLDKHQPHKKKKAKKYKIKKTSFNKSHHSNNDKANKGFVSIYKPEESLQLKKEENICYNNPIKPISTIKKYTHEVDIASMDAVNDYIIKPIRTCNWNILEKSNSEAVINHNNNINDRTSKEIRPITVACKIQTDLQLSFPQIIKGYGEEKENTHHHNDNSIQNNGNDINGTNNDMNKTDNIIKGLTNLKPEIKSYFYASKNKKNTKRIFLMRSQIVQNNRSDIAENSRIYFQSKMREKEEKRNSLKNFQFLEQQNIRNQFLYRSQYNNPKLLKKNNKPYQMISNTMLKKKLESG